MVSLLNTEGGIYVGYTCTVYSAYSHREGRGVEQTREKVRGAIVHKAGRNTDMTDCISSPETVLNTSKDNIRA